MSEKHNLELTYDETLMLRLALSETIAEWATHADSLRSEARSLQAAQKIEEQADAAYALQQKVDALLPGHMRNPEWVKSGKIEDYLRWKDGNAIDRAVVSP